MTNQGTIYLVGTGPGETGLITAKGLALIREADAIVGDVLSHARLLDEARPEAEIHDVGCRANRNKLPQVEINRLLLELAQRSQTVVRLWPGDPYVFGRAAQELAAARQAGIRAEVVPGVTSAIAAPAYAGVPLTHWEYAASFAVVSGYPSKNPDVRSDWTALAGMETVVILMPLDDLPEIAAKLMAAGRSPDTPALAVGHGTLPQQRQVSATLGAIAEAVEAHQITHPAIVVIGRVVELAGQLAWFGPGDEYPLRGRRVLVTRPAHQSADFMAALRGLGAEPIAFPTIEIRPVEETRPLDDAIQRIAQWTGRRTAQRSLRPQADPSSPEPDSDEPPAPAAASLPALSAPYQWLVLTSVNGVAAFWERLTNAGLDSRCLAPLQIAAIGPATAAALRRRSIGPDLVPEVYTAEGVLAAFDRLDPVAGQRFLLARADIARRTLAEGLIERGAQVDEIAAYRTVPVQNGAPPPAADIVTFTSSSTVQGYVNCLAGRSPAEALQKSKVVCIGPITAATARELAVPVTAVAQEYTIEGLLNILREGNL